MHDSENIAVNSVLLHASALQSHNDLILCQNLATLMQVMLMGKA